MFETRTRDAIGRYHYIISLDRCPSGTDGKQCETAPERCIGNPCMHNGRCQDFGSGLNCTCPDDYTGIGCQYEYDACQAGACKNGATCVDEGPGFTCICPSGYTGRIVCWRKNCKSSSACNRCCKCRVGKTCEDDIIDCKENSCPPSATCIDLTGKFFCQCPFNLTGDDCRKCTYIYIFQWKRKKEISNCAQLW